jgi:hypothetical protein
VISVKAGGGTAAVTVASGAITALSDPANGIVSLVVGLIGVWLSRWVFVGRENRRLGKPQRWNDTLPLTLVAMLVAGVVIHDRQMGLSAAAFTGLGVGWAAVLLLDIMGERITNMLRAGFAMPVDRKLERHLDHSGMDGKVTPSEVDLPDDMLGHLQTLDRKPGGDRPGKS